MAFTVTFGGIVLALAIAFGWEGRELAKDFLERLYNGEGKDNNEPSDGTTEELGSNFIEMVTRMLETIHEEWDRISHV